MAPPICLWVKSKARRLFYPLPSCSPLWAKPFHRPSPASPANEGNFSAVGLPAGLSINSATGEISGSPVQDGEYQVTIILENEYGKSNPKIYP